MPIVQAVGIATAHGSMGDPRSEKIAEAMRKALEAAQAEGITDPDVLRERMLKARDAA